MRRVLPAVAAVALIFVAAACSDANRMLLVPQRTTLNYDGPNDNAPTLVGGTYEAGVRFPATQMATYAGGQLLEVEYWIQFLPTAVAVKIYGAGTASSPGPLLYSADVTSSVTTMDWSTHALAMPVDLDGGDLWIAIEFQHLITQKVIGCDAGPGAPNGDWLYSSNDGMWLPFSTRFPISVNWNVRGTVEYLD